MANLWRLYFDVFSCNFDDWLHCEKNVTSLLFDCSLWKNIQTLDTTCHKKDFHWQFSTILTHATLPAVSFLDVRNIIYLCTLRAAQLKRWCAAEKQPVLTFNWHSPTAPRQRWLTCRSPPPTLLPQREKVPQFHCHFLTETQGIKKECLDGYVELNILGAGIHRSLPRCFLKHCKHNSDRFSWLVRKLLTLRRPQQLPSVGGSRRTKSCKLLSALRKPNCKCVWKHSWCSGDGSDDWRLFALLAIYNSPMSANKAKPLPVRCSPMMDDLLRDFQEPLLFETLHPHPEPTHKNTLSTRPFPEHRPRGETDTFTRSSAKFPRRGMKTSGSRIHSRLSDKNKAGWEDCVSVAYTYLKEWCEILSPQHSLLSWWQCGIVSFNPLAFFFLPFFVEINGRRGLPTEWRWCVLGAVTPADEAHLFFFTHQTRSNCELGVK